MLKHNIIDLYKTFSKQDIKKFEKFLISPYFNSSSKMYRLFKEIIRFHPDFKSTELNKKNLSQKSSDSGKYNESTLRDAMSELLKLTLKFLYFESAEKNELKGGILLLQELFYRNNLKLYSKNLKNISNKLETNKIVDSDYLFNKYSFRVSKFNYEISNEKLLHKKDITGKINELNSIGFELYKFYISEMVSIYLNSIILSNKFNIDHSVLPLNLLINKKEIENILKTFYKEDPVPVNLYYNLLITFDDFTNESLYVKYKAEILKYKNILSKDELSFHYCWLINYCLMKKKDNSGLSFNNELMDLFSSLLNKKLYKNRKSEYLSSELYRDILLHGIHLKKYSWVANLIEEYNSELNPDERYNLLNYSYTYLYSSMGNYSKALIYYNNITLNKFIYKYDIKNIVLKMYYELNYFEEALCEIKSYREFLRNNVMVNDNRKVRTGTFLKYLERLILLRINSEKKELEYLEKKLLGENVISFKDWLLEKITEILKN